MIKISGCTFENNDVSIKIESGDQITIDQNTFKGNNLNFVDEKNKALEIPGGNIIDGTNIVEDNKSPLY